MTIDDYQPSDKDKAEARRHAGYKGEMDWEIYYAHLDFLAEEYWRCL